jgi:hypothetical protein
MNLESIQGYVVTQLLLDATLGTLGATCIIADDGSYPKTTGRAEALAATGICLTVLDMECGGIEDQAGDGGMSFWANITIVVDDRTETNGTGISSLEAVRLSLAALCGKPTGDLETHIQPGAPPWENFGRIDAENRCTVNLRYLCVL